MSYYKKTKKQIDAPSRQSVQSKDLRWLAWLCDLHWVGFSPLSSHILGAMSLPALPAAFTVDPVVAFLALAGSLVFRVARWFVLKND